MFSFAGEKVYVLHNEGGRGGEGGGRGGGGGGRGGGGGVIEGSEGIRGERLKREK